MSYKENESIPPDDDAYYEAVASQEEIYLEECEVEVVEVIAEYVPPPTKPSVDACEELKDERVEAAEDLITGDSDDPPLSEESITDALNPTG